MTDEKRHRDFAFTDYVLNPVFWIDLETNYLIVGDETCPNTGKKHGQGYVQFKNGKTLSAAIKQFKPRHIEIAKGTAEQNIKYCSKEKVLLEIGVPKKQGKRTDLIDIKALLDEGKSADEIADSNFSQWVIYRRAFDAYKMIKEEKRNWVTEVYFLWGESGTGKTRRAVEAGAKLLSYDGKFIGNYNGEDIVCFDDVSPYTWNRSELLKLCDRYEHQIGIKGGFRNWKPRVIYFTSNFDVKDCPPFNDKAMARRFTCIEQLHKGDCTEVSNR